MTWFRVGGAGVPVSLKNGMNAVLNKKFGTSGQNYPPAGWPADVNLLGPLPEKTVAGAIAHTDDAADTVPVKSVICSIVPKQAGSGTPSPTNVRALSGYTGMTVSQRNKNLLMLADADYTNTQNNVTIDYDSESQMFSLSGVNHGSSAYVIGNFQNSSLKNVVMKNATYTFSHNLPTGAYAQLTYRKVNSSSVGTLCYIAGNGTQRSVTFTLPSDYDYTVNAQIGIAATAGDVTAANLYMQIEVGSSASSFVKYNAVSDVSDSWSSIGTIYGGERDLTNGTLKETFEIFTFDGSQDENWGIFTVNTNQTLFRIYDTSRKSGTLSGSSGIPSFCNMFEKAPNESSGRTDGKYSGTGTNIDFIYNSAVDLTAWRSFLSNNPIQIVIEKDSATTYSSLQTYDFETLYAVNNFYSDIEGGQTQVTYRQDIALALQALQGSRSLSASLMRSGGSDLEERSEDPEEVSEPEENIQNTEEQEGENDER